MTRPQSGQIATLQQLARSPRHARSYSPLRDKLRAIVLFGYSPKHRAEL